MLSICVCGLAQGRPRDRCYVNTLVGQGGYGDESCRFGFLFCHLSILQSDLSLLEMTGKPAVNHNSSLEHQPFKGLNPFSPRRKWGTENGSKDCLWPKLVKIGQKKFPDCKSLSNDKMPTHCFVISTDVQALFLHESRL